MRHNSIKIILAIIVAICLILAAYFYQVGDLGAFLSLILTISVTILGAILQSLWQTNLLAPLGSGQMRSKRWFYNFRNDYLRFLIYQNRDFDIKGLSTQTKYALELRQVFVELSLRPQDPHTATTDPVPVIPKEMRRGSHSLWRFLSLGNNKLGMKLVLLGPPGSGKTTLLRNVTLALSKPRRFRTKGLNKIPALIYLRDVAPKIIGNDLVLLPEIIDQNLKKWDVISPNSWFEQKLRKGDCLIMFDGLDEIAGLSERRQMSEWVERQIQAYPKSIFIMTSRPHGYRENLVAGTTVLEIMPFTRIQIGRFIHNWYLANELQYHRKDDIGVRMTAKSGAGDLLARLDKTPALFELAVNPLLLTMIATVHRFRSSLPGKRVDLYKEICEVFLGKRQQSKGLNVDLSPAQKQTVLQKLAYELMIQNKREISRDSASEIIQKSVELVQPNLTSLEFLKSIENESGLLVERENGVYSFAHKTFQEYLASVYALENKLEKDLISYLDNDWWNETIRLYCAQTDATNIIQACLKKISVIRLTLAIECFEEARQVQAHVRAYMDNIYQDLSESGEQEIRHTIAESMLKRRLNKIFLVPTHTILDSTLINCAEYQLFLDIGIASEQEFQDSVPLHWSTGRYPAGRATQPALGISPQGAKLFCEWLTRQTKGSGTISYRIPSADEIERRSLQGISGFWMTTSSAKECVLYLTKDKISGLEKEIYQEVLIREISVVVKRMRSINYRPFNEQENKWPDNQKWELGGDLFYYISRISRNELNSASKKVLGKLLEMTTARTINLESKKHLGFPGIISKNSFVNPEIEFLCDGIIQLFRRLELFPHNRLQVLFLAIVFEYLAQLSIRGDIAQAYQNRIHYLLDIYVDLLVVVAREANKLEPYEGILTVAEKKMA